MVEIIGRRAWQTRGELENAPRRRRRKKKVTGSPEKVIRATVVEHVTHGDFRRGLFAAALRRGFLRPSRATARANAAIKCNVSLEGISSNNSSSNNNNNTFVC